MTTLRNIIFLVVFTLIGVSGAYAQEISTEEPAPISTSVAANAPLPASTRLTGLRAVYQQFNRCSAAALTIQLSYFGWEGTYDDAIRGLNPHAEDVAVRLDEMIEFAEEQGLRGIERVGGTLDMLKALVAGGFPVLVENIYYDGPDSFRDWMSHNRVIMGYDDTLQVLYSFDSLLGNGEDGQGRPIPYADLDVRWKPFNRDYLVLYRPEEEERLQAIMGDHWDPVYNAEWALEQSQAELDTENADSFTLFNIGSSLVALGRYEEAADYFDQARGLGLPWRMLWYQYGPFEAYYHTGRYEDVLQMARDVIAVTPGVEEVYYYAGLAYEALGDTFRAEANYQVAIQRNVDFTAAIEALARLREEATETPTG